MSNYMLGKSKSNTNLPPMMPNEPNSSLVLSRQQSEQEIKNLIDQRDICLEIRNVVLGTLACTKKEIQEQKDIIFELRDHNKSLKEINDRLKDDLKIAKKNYAKKEKVLYTQIQEQQKVNFFFNFF